MKLPMLSDGTSWRQMGERGGSLSWHALQYWSSPSGLVLVLLGIAGEAGPILFFRRFWVRVKVGEFPEWTGRCVSACTIPEHP